MKSSFTPPLSTSAQITLLPLSSCPPETSQHTIKSTLSMSLISFRCPALEPWGQQLPMLRPAASTCAQQPDVRDETPAPDPAMCPVSKTFPTLMDNFRARFPLLSPTHLITDPLPSPAFQRDLPGTHSCLLILSLPASLPPISHSCPALPHLPEKPCKEGSCSPGQLVHISPGSLYSGCPIYSYSTWGVGVCILVSLFLSSFPV